MRVFVAEDDRASGLLLEGLLGGWGYEVVRASDGREALGFFEDGGRCSFALLDWMMPDVSGIDICRRIRELEGSDHYTYVIFVTARGEKRDMEEGFEAGADDYVTKPIDADLLEHRLFAGRRIVEYEDRLGRYGREMESLARQRAEQLVQSERLSTIGQLSAGIAHEINNPVTFISGNTQILQECWPASEAALEVFLDGGAGDLASKARLLLEETPKMLESILKGTKRVGKIVSSLNAYACRQSGVKKAVDVHDVIEDALGICQNALKYHVEVVREFDADAGSVLVAPQQIQQVMVNLMVNTADALDRPGLKGRLVIRTDRVSSERVRICFRDTGPGLPDDVRTYIWDPFFTTKSSADATGLGLSIARGIVLEHGGEISAGNAVGGGAEFTILLPAAPEEL